MSKTRIPETRLQDWFNKPCPSGDGAQDAIWHCEVRPPSGGRLDLNEVAKMVLHNPLKSQESGIGGYAGWRLEVFNRRSLRDDHPVAIRRVEMGPVPSFERVEDAVMAVVRMGAEEAGYSEEEEHDVFVTFSGTDSTLQNALSVKEAESIAFYKATVTGSFFDELKEFGRDYDTDGLEARRR